jgi:hypothetical protein
LHVGHYYGRRKTFAGNVCHAQNGVILIQLESSKVIATHHVSGLPCAGKAEPGEIWHSARHQALLNLACFFQFEP